MIEIIQDVDLAIEVMRNAGKWLRDTGKNPSKWWQLQNLNKAFLFQYAKPEEFVVVLSEERIAAAAILQFDQDAQDWTSVDHGKPPKAMYIHWICVHRDFAKKGFPKIIADFAQQKALEMNIHLLRYDLNAQIPKLRRVCEDMGFHQVGIVDEGYRKTAFYQKEI